MDINSSVEIKFVGQSRTIFNVVSYGQFLNVYKPKGWVLKDNSIVEEEPKKMTEEKQEEVVNLEEKPVEKIVEELKTTDETVIKNLNTAKKKTTTSNKFNDKIIKE